MITLLGKILSKISDWIYPPKCIICQNILSLELPRWFCEQCRQKLVYIEKPVCIKCGRQAENENTTCPLCAHKTFSFHRNVSLFVYDGDIKDVIHRFKFGNHPEFGEGLAILMAEVFMREFDSQIDCIVPIPMHRKKERSRGFNQAAILANGVSKAIGVPVCTGLSRKKQTKPQGSLSAAEREENVKNAFEVKERMFFQNKKVLLIDDVFTTGSTVESCAKTLISAGAKEVSSLTLSSTRQTNT